MFCLLSTFFYSLYLLSVIVFVHLVVYTCSCSFYFNKYPRTGNVLNFELEEETKDTCLCLTRTKTRTKAMNQSMNRNRQFNGRSMMRIRPFSKMNDNELLEKLKKSETIEAKTNDGEKTNGYWARKALVSIQQDRI